MPQFNRIRFARRCLLSSLFFCSTKVARARADRVAWKPGRGEGHACIHLLSRRCAPCHQLYMFTCPRRGSISGSVRIALDTVRERRHKREPLAWARGRGRRPATLVACNKNPLPRCVHDGVGASASEGFSSAASLDDSWAKPSDLGNNLER